MVGELVSVAMLPRCTAYVGPGTYTTVPMLVEEFVSATLTFWRGVLVGGAATDPFRAYFEESHDAQTWTTAPPTQPVTTTNASAGYPVDFTKRWFRIRVELAANAGGVVGISLWMAGTMVRRVE